MTEQSADLSVLDVGGFHLLGCDFEPKTGPKARRHKIYLALFLALFPNLRKKSSSQDLSEEAPSFSEISACPRPLAFFSFRFSKIYGIDFARSSGRFFAYFSKIAKSSSKSLCPKPAGETLGLFWEKGPNNRHLTCFCDVAVENHDFAQYR